VSNQSGSAVSGFVGFLLGLAIVAALVALAFGLGIFAPDGGTAVASSPPPTTSGSVQPSGEPSALPSAVASPAASNSPAPGSAAPATAGATPGGTHIVQLGETLSSIGELYGVPWQLIAEVNGIEAPYTIAPRQELTIPALPAPSAGAAVHFVQSGESIFSIAELYGISPTDLADANPDVEDWNVIFVGQRLVIPGFEGASPSP
jgi:LysM repeat protein